MSKVNNEDINDTISVAFIVNFEYVSRLALVFLFLTLST